MFVNTAPCAPHATPQFAVLSQVRVEGNTKLIKIRRLSRIEKCQYREYVLRTAAGRPASSRWWSLNRPRVLIQIHLHNMNLVSSLWRNMELVYEPDSASGYRIRHTNIEIQQASVTVFNAFICSLSRGHCARVSSLVCRARRTTVCKKSWRLRVRSPVIYRDYQDGRSSLSDSPAWHVAVLLPQTISRGAAGCHGYLNNSVQETKG